MFGASGTILHPDSPRVSRARLTFMLAHRDVTQNSSEAVYSFCLLAHKHLAPVSPLESTLPQVLILNNLNSFRINTYAKTRGRAPTLFLPSASHLLQREHALLDRVYEMASLVAVSFAESRASAASLAA